MVFKSSIDATCIVFLLTLFTNTVSSATVYQSTFYDDYGNINQVYLVTEANQATGLYFDYHDGGRINPHALLSSTPFQVAATSIDAFDLTSESIIGASLTGDPALVFLDVDELDARMSPNRLRRSFVVLFA